MTKYFCDICGAETEKLNAISIRTYFMSSLTTVDACKSCTAKYLKELKFPEDWNQLCEAYDIDDPEETSNGDTTSDTSGSSSDDSTSDSGITGE